MKTVALTLVAILAIVQAKPSFPHIDFAPPIFAPQPFHAPATFFPAAPLPVAPAPVAFAPAPVAFAPAPVAPVLHTPFSLPVAAPVTKFLPPVYEPLAFAAPSYRAIPGPRTTSHHVSFGYAFPPLAKLSHHHHHSIF